jgi:hypothetical protein
MGFIELTYCRLAPRRCARFIAVENRQLRSVMSGMPKMAIVAVGSLDQSDLGDP